MLECASTLRVVDMIDRGGENVTWRPGGRSRRRSYEAVRLHRNRCTNLHCGPASSSATGYELAARGGVPRSAIYGVLKRLEQAGLVNAVRGKPARYIPLAPERLIEHLESRFSRDIKDFRDAVTQVSDLTRRHSRGQSVGMKHRLEGRASNR